jgi:hypothetical protein
MELTEETIQMIRNLSFDPNAKINRISGVIGMTWSDEVPNDGFGSLFIEQNRGQIVRLFLIRMKYWDKGTMSQEDQLYWREAQRQFPDWPLFRRLELNEEERRAYDTASEDIKFLKEVCFSLADEIEVITEDGIAFEIGIIKRRRKGWWQFWR